ncbi:MAG: cobalt-precorrin-5B (C(1))-methyltransferase, partial [Rhodoplanes sp.]
RGAVDLAVLAALADSAGGSPALRERIVAANTAAEAFAHAQVEGIALGEAVARAAQASAMRVVAGRAIAVEIVLFDRDGRLVGHAPFVSAHDAPPRNLRR